MYCTGAYLSNPKEVGNRWVKENSRTHFKISLHTHEKDEIQGRA